MRRRDSFDTDAAIVLACILAVAFLLGGRLFFLWVMNTTGFSP